MKFPKRVEGNGYGREGYECWSSLAQDELNYIFYINEPRFVLRLELASGDKV
jgi:hypothetical protein